MKYTTNYNLKKPEYTDNIDVVANDDNNLDIIDSELKARVLTSDVNVVATANKILPLNVNSKLPADITGDSATVAGKTVGNATGNVPLSNGTVNANLNADKVDGYDLNQGVKTTDSPTHVKMTLTQDGTAAPMTVTSGIKVTNLNVDKVDGYDLDQGVKTTDSPTHVRLTLSQASGTSPMVVTSPTVVTNLNADKVDGHDLDQDVKVASSPTHVALTLTQTDGITPMTVTSKTKVANLNADQVDGYDVGNTTGNVPVSNGTLNTNLNADKVDGYDVGNANGNVPVSNGTVNADLNADKVDGHDLNQDVNTTSSPTHVALTLSQADGTTPMTVTSKTKVANLNVDQVDGCDVGNATGNIPVSNGTLNTNLNADKLDGNHASAFATSAQGTKADNALPANNYTAQDVLTKLLTVDGATSGLDADKLDSLESGNASGNIPISNGTVNTNLNADKVDGYDLNQGVKTTDSPTHVRLTLSQADGTTPMIITSKTKVINLNVDQLDGYDAGNASGNIPLSNGTVNAGLNADKVDGYDLNQGVKTTDSPTHVKITLSQATGTAPMTVTSTTKVTNLNVDQVDGYDAGNATGNVPVSNGIVNTNLNADMLDGNHASAFATAVQGTEADNAVRWMGLLNSMNTSDKSSIVSAINEVNTNLHDIGGRNLIFDSSFELGIATVSAINSATLLRECQGSAGLCRHGGYRYKVTPSINVISGICVLADDLTVGKKYTASAWVRTSTSKTPSISIYDSSWATVATAGITSITVGVWTLFTVTFIATETSHRVGIVINDTVADVFYVDCFKCEEGSICTAWSPNEGDYGIVESGSNANGYYIKYGDGTLVCYGCTTSNIAINSAWGTGGTGGIYCGTLPVVIYPVAFINTPSFVGQCAGNGSSIWTTITGAGNGTYSPLIDLTRIGALTAKNWPLNWKAIGRWY